MNGMLISLILSGFAYDSMVIHEQYEKAKVLSYLIIPSDEHLFYKAIQEYSLKQKKSCIDNLKTYINLKTSHNPNHLFVAEKLLEQVTAEQEKIDDIAEDMKIVERKLRLGMGGPTTQKIQKDIIKKLDEEIESIEKQMESNQYQASGNKQSQIPIADSKIMEGSGEGKVENKKLIASGENWGSLPPKEKTKAVEEITRNLAPHIREAAEGYTKKLNVRK